MAQRAAALWGPTCPSPCATSYRINSGGSSQRCRWLAVRCSGHEGDERPTLQQPRPLVVRSQPLTRAAAPPPQPVPVEHSSAYLLRKRKQLGEDGEDGSAAAASGSLASPPESFNGSALEWVLRKADESLDEIEENPPEYAKVLYDISTGPIGKAASSTVTTAAKVTVEVGTEALKAAAPVGKWALKQGFKLAVGAVSKGLASAVLPSDKKRKGSGKKGSK